MSESLRFDLLANDRASSVFDKVGSSAEQSGGQVEGFGSKLGNLAKLTGVGVALGAVTAGIAGMTQAMSNEKSTDRLTAALNATPAQAERMGKLASKLYAGAWGDSMDDVSHAIESVSSSFQGLGTGKGLEKVTIQAMDFASVFETDLPRAVSVASTVMKSGLAKNATEAFDLITAASQRVPADLRGDILDASEEYSQFFSTLGFSGEQAFGMLAAGSDKGAYGIDKIGDAIKEFTIRSTDFSKATLTAYESIGLSGMKMGEGILKGGNSARKATQQTIDALLSVKDPAKQSQAALALFGTPMEDLNVRDIPDFLRSMQNGAKGMDGFKGSIDRAGATLNDNAATNIESFKRQITTTFVDTLGNKVLPKLSEFASDMASGKGPAGAFGDAVKKISDNFGTIGPLLGVVAGGIVAYSAASRIAAVVTALQAAGTTAATGATWSLNAALRANPIGLVVTALTLLVGGLVLAYQKSDTFRGIADSVFGVMKQVWGVLMENKQAFLVLLGPIGMVGAALITAYQKSETFRDIVDGAFSVVKRGAEALWSGLRSAFSKIEDGFEALGAAGTWLWNNALQPAFHFIVSGVASILDMWSSMLGVLAKVPGFGWAAKAADAMAGAAEKARALADGIQKIPPGKTVNVTVAYHYTGLRGPGGSGPTRGGAGDLGILPRGKVEEESISLGQLVSDSIAKGMKGKTKAALAAVGELVAKAGDKLKELRDKAADIMSGVAGAMRGALDLGNLGGVDADGNKLNAANQIANFAATAGQFARSLAAAASKGINGTLISQIASMGPSQGLTAAQALAAMDQAEVASTNASLATVDKFAMQLGNTVLTTTSLPAEIAAAQGTYAALLEIRDDLKNSPRNISFVVNDATDPDKVVAAIRKYVNRNGKLRGVTKDD